MTDNLQAVIDVAKQAAMAGGEPLDIEPGFLGTYVTAAGVRVVDAERYLPRPRRKTGKILVHTQASLVDYVNRHRTDATVIFADRDGPTFTAVLDHHGPEAQQLTAIEAEPDGETVLLDTTLAPALSSAGWGGHVAVLPLRVTTEWQEWTGISGHALGQVQLAEFLEDHVADIVRPDAATMIGLAKTFEATKSVAFKDDIVLESGSRKLRYEEVVAARAGQAGDIEIPREIELALVPYEGADRYKVTARFRYRIKDGGLLLTLVLVRPDLVVDAAFGDILDAVENATEVLTLHAAAPTARAAPPVITSHQG